MPRIPVPAATEPPRTPSPSPQAASDASGRMAAHLADACLVGLFLGLTFLLGVFPLNDTDYWWHLRTGDLIRQTGQIPRVDLFTFGASDHAWIDLHWGFQVGLSWLYQLGGVDATNLAKCLLTTAALALLLFSRRRSWPLWVMVLAWMPALLLLGGRMYVRPETVTLLYLAIDLAILSRIDRHPRLAWAVPVVQLLWVNTQGLFVFGPVLFGMAVVDAALRPGAFGKGRHAWWKAVLGAALATGVACLFNPYGIFGALFPIQLAGTMTNPVFGHIGELQPLLVFLERAGLRNLPLQLHLATLVLGGLSFVLPILWRVSDRVALARSAGPETRKAAKKRRKSGPKAAEPSWTLSPFRLMLYAAFSLLSFKATRNSHQFAAVVGTVTAWNFGEWAASILRRRAEARKPSHPLVPRIASMVVVAAAIGLVGSGKFYDWEDESRTVGMGERPLWFAHEAAKFAGSAGMPEKFLTFHNGLAGLFEYHNGPGRKVFADARLEVMGPGVYGQDADLGDAIANRKPGWSERVAALGPPSPGILVDHIQSIMAPLAATLLESPGWRCVYYDPIASVYLPGDANPSARAVDFGARHFGLEPGHEPRGFDPLLASARSLWNHASYLTQHGQPERAGPMIALGLDHARRAKGLDRSSAEAWRLEGLLESLRDQPVARVAPPFDPIFDLSADRAIYALTQADARQADDVKTLTYLLMANLSRGLNEAAIGVSDRLTSLSLTPDQAKGVMPYVSRIARIQVEIRDKPSLKFENRGDLDRVVAGLLEQGRAATAADLLEKSFPPPARTWELSDRIATLRLHLGRPDLARAAWQAAASVPRPAVREARVAATYLVEGDLDQARKSYRQALAADPNLFEAHYGLAVLESDDGRAAEALASAKAAEASAASDVARSSARVISTFAARYAGIKPATPATP